LNGSYRPDSAINSLHWPLVAGGGFG